MIWHRTLMNNQTPMEMVAYAVLTGAIVYCWAALVPVVNVGLNYFRNPAYFALVGATLSASVYLAVSVFVSHAEVWRRILLALFLAGMPLIYLWAAIIASDRTAIFVESAGFAVFLSVAVFAYRRSQLLLGVGIAAHGIAWDAWHHHRSAFIAPWYPLGCLLIDVAFFGVVAAQALRN